MIMIYAQPELLVYMRATETIANHDGVNNKDGSTCKDSHIPSTSAGAYEVDE
jgi:hypothetical protein